MSGTTLMTSLYQAFRDGDVPTVLGAMDPEVHWHEAESNPYQPSGEPWIGPEAVLNNLFVKLGGEWDGFTVKPVTYHEAGDTVTVQGRYTGVYKATGRSVDAQFCHVWTLKAGKIVHFQQYTDTAKMQHAMDFVTA